ncbi:pheA operon leader peptide PheL [Sodalis sp. dw_96]|nr:pheA operon leader peptide PheL [Sodalis sp. dw_96]
MRIIPFFFAFFFTFP